MENAGTLNIEMTIISKGVKESKICKSFYEVYIFERDMASKHNLLFTNIPYAIKKTYLD